jgi:protein KRI1
MATVVAELDGVGAGGDDKKPTWDDDIDIDDIVPPNRDEASHASAVKERKKAKKKERKKRTRGDDADAVDIDEMDADASTHSGRQWDEVEWDGTEEMRKRVLDQYMEELYELEFNDMVCSSPLTVVFSHAVLTRTTPVHLGCRDAYTLPLRSCSRNLIWAERPRNSACR